MRALLLVILLTTFSQFGRTQSLSVFMTTTDCSAYGVCDGTITMWVEGASAADSFMFLLDVAPAPVVYDTIIVSDTIVTLTGICPGAYTVTLDTLWGSCPNYPGGCCNCTGSTSCGGAAGGGASGTVGGPGPDLIADYFYETSECLYDPWGGGCVYVNIQGQAPPFMVSINNLGWTPYTPGCMFDPTLYCGSAPPFVDVMDATGQVVSASLNWWNIVPCMDPNINVANTTTNVCSGGTINIPFIGTYDAVSWSAQSPSLGFINGYSGFPSNGVSFSAPNVSASEVINVTITPYMYGAFSTCEGDAVNVVVNVDPIPTVNPTDIAICHGDPAVLYSNSSTTNISWSGGIVDGVAFNPSVTSTYTVTATSPNGCITTGDATVTVLPSPVVDAGPDQMVCEGEQVTLSGSGSMNYTWDNGISDNIAFTPTIGTTTYEVSVTDANGCQNTDQVDVFVNALPIVDAGIDQTVCDGDQVTLSGSGATSYVWDNGITNNTSFNPALGTTTYQVIGTDANGCQNTDQVDVVMSLPPTIDAGVDQTICAGDQVMLAGSGGVSFTWNNGISDNVAFTPPLGTTSYEVTGTDANGCQNTDQVDVLVNSLPVVDAGIDQTVCDGNQVTLVGSGTNSISWDNGISNNVAFTPSAGTTTYQVTGTDANGCQNTDQVDVSVNALPIVDAGLDQTVCDGDQVTLSGSGATSYSWDNGISNNIAFTSPFGTTTYQITGTDANGCQNIDEVDVSVNALPIVDAGLDQTVCDGDQVTLSGSGGTSYVWDNGITDNTSFTPTVGIATYQVTGTDANGCVNTDQVDVLVNSLPIIDAGIDQTVCDGDQITLMGVGGTSYAWDNGITDNIAFAPPIGTTAYEVTGTDANGCQNSDQVDVSVNPLPIIDAGVDQTVCDGDQVTLSGSGATSYSWDNGISNNIAFTSPFGTTTYQITGTDANGCQNIDEVDVSVNALPIVDAGLDQTVCDGDQVTLSGSGGTSYVWDNGITDNTSFTPTVGIATYQVTGTDANGCVNTDQVDVLVNSLPIIDAGIDQTVCDGDQVILIGVGGTSYAWDNGITDNIAFTPPIGTTAYEVTGTDANGCQNSDQVDVSVNPLPIIDAGVDQTVCDGDQVTLSGSGATSYSWDNGISNNIAFTPPVGTTTYQITGTDANGCQNIDEVDVVVNPLPIINAGADQTLCEGDQIALSGSGGISYVWDNGVTNGTSFSPPSGITIYSVMGIDANGCENTDAVAVTTEPVPTVSIIGGPLEGCSPLNVELTNTTLGNIVDCNWTISGGTSLAGCGTVSTQLTEPGYYDVTLSISTLGGCFTSETYTDFIYIEPDPIAAFSFPSSDFTTLNPEIQFVNQSSGASTYWWDFNDNSLGTNETHPLHLFPDESTTYIIDLVAFSDLGCVDSAQAAILIKEELIYYVPNSFSPDGNQHNNVFEPVFHSGFDPYNYELQIFNRWGEVIFTSNDASYGWDGTYLGQMVQDGVYTWTIKFKLLDTDEYKEDRGHVNLIR